ncbi:hypothetical protein AB0L88_06150 [Saccharopolyspora shandongensis]|uniref:hypothetical protein n=1 Tax=Saccharopolyspora shandongensis TaxID=418495 RepID=UPI003440F779
MSRLLLKLVDGFAHQLSFDDRLLLAAELLSPEEPVASPSDEQHAPDWERQRLRLAHVWQIMDRCNLVLTASDTGVTSTRLAKQVRALREEAGAAVAVMAEAGKNEGFGAPRGMDVEDLRQEVLRLQAEQIDADLIQRKPPNSQHEPRWAIRYRENTGAVTASRHSSDPDGTSEEVGGFAPTAVAAADLVASWTVPRAAVTFHPAPPHRPQRCDPGSTPALQLHDMTMRLLERGESRYEDFVAACKKTRAELGETNEISEWIRGRVNHLNSKAPHLTLVHGRELGTVPDTEHNYPLGSLVSVQWVNPALVISTYSPAWGEFDGHQEESLPNIIHGLAESQTVDAFARRLFDDPIDLTRIPAWAGPVYELGEGGCHRIHATRVLNLPWMAAVVNHRQWPVTWKVDPRKLRPQHALIEGLNMRGIIEAEVVPPSDDLWARVRCTRLPAPWLVREPEFATAMNAVYEATYPGALAQLGIPEDIATRPEAWRSWLS